MDYATAQQGYELAVKEGKVQAAKYFRKVMLSKYNDINNICESLLTSTPADYRNLDAFVLDAWSVVATTTTAH